MSIHHRLPTLLACTALIITMAACGSDSTSSVTVTPGEGDRQEFDDEGVVVAGQGSDDFIVRGEPGNRCIDIGDACVALDGVRERYCDEPGAVVDVVVVDGEVVGGVCYPPPSDEDPDLLEPDENGDWAVPRNRNGGVLLFPEDTDGIILEGDIVLEGQRTTLYGNGRDRTILDGDLLIRANNSRVRGLTVLGDVIIENFANNVGLSYVDIHGDLVVRGNNGTLIRVTVLGDATLAGNDIEFLASRVAGTFSPDGRATACDDSWSILLEDADDQTHANDESAAQGDEGTGPADDTQAASEEGDEEGATEDGAFERPTYSLDEPLEC